MKVPYLLALLSVLYRSRSQEVSTPSSLLLPRNHNHHPFDAQQFLKSLKAEPTKQGPVLFPNDAPPPPRPPLIVTARPLVESIARSELGQVNSETSQSQINGVSFVPYLTRVNEYRPYHPAPTFNYNFVPTQIPYADVVKKSRLNTLGRDNRYNDYEENTVLPPIYKALADHAEQKVLKLKENNPNYNIYKVQAPLPEYTRNYQNNDINEENLEYDQNKNYAFSYRVNDHKTGDDFSHSQRSSGSATNGEYRVRLPDGRMQIVSYTADENGYKADVRYDDDDNGNTIDNYQQNSYNDNKHNKVYVNKNNNAFVGRNSNNNAYTIPNNNVAYDNNNNIYAIKNNLDYTDRSLNNDYVEKKEIKPVSEGDDYYHYPDTSKEYNDYSSEYNSNYEPHKSKYTIYNNNENIATNNGIASTVKPSYEELKDLFATKGYSTQNYDPVELNVPSTTPVPYDGTTEHVVVIGPKTPNLYTSIRNSVINTGSYASPIVATSPRSYLVSTIASLKNKVQLGTKPILSDRFIDKINKYLSFN